MKGDTTPAGGDRNLPSRRRRVLEGAIAVATLRFLVSFIGFGAASAFAFVAAVALRQDGRGFDWPRGMSLCFPAACTNALTGQNGCLTRALMIGGFCLLERRRSVPLPPQARQRWQSTPSLPPFATPSGNRKSL